MVKWSMCRWRTAIFRPNFVLYIIINIGFILNFDLDIKCYFNPNPGTKGEGEKHK